MSEAVSTRKPNFLKKFFGHYALPMYIMTNPFDGFYEMKYLGRGRLKLAFFNLVVLLISVAVRDQYASIVVNEMNPLELNSLATWAMIVGALFLFCVSNWSVTSLTNGEGKFKEIFMMMCYAMTPLVLTIIPSTIFSRFLSADEAAFYEMIVWIGMAYFVFLVYCGLIVVHNYGAAKAIGTIVLTFIALLIIVFLITLLLSLWQQLWVFAYSIYTELMFR